MFLTNVIVVVARTGKYGGKRVGSSIQETSKGRRHSTTKTLCTPLLSHLASFVQREKLIAAFVCIQIHSVWLACFIVFINSFGSVNAKITGYHTASRKCKNSSHTLDLFKHIQMLNVKL